MKTHLQIIDILKTQLGIGESTPLRWAWLQQENTADLAIFLHAHAIPENTQIACTEAITEGEEVQEAAFVQGYCNLTFTSKAWETWTTHWCDNPESLLADVGIALRPENPIQPTYGKDTHILEAAQALAAIDGWQSPTTESHSPKPAELHLLRALLGLGDAGNPNPKHINDEIRQRHIRSLCVHLRNLWQQPILITTDPQGAAFRQRILKMTTYIATQLQGN
jgi:hypothetical protein